VEGVYDNTCKSFLNYKLTDDNFRGFQLEVTTAGVVNNNVCFFSSLIFFLYEKTSY